MRWTWSAAAVLIAGAMLTACSSSTSSTSTGTAHDRTVTVPNVVGLPATTAELELSESGLRLSGNPTGAGTVIAQNPPAGLRLASGSGVTLQVAPTEPTVPAVATCSTSQLQLTLDRVVPGLAQQPGAFFRLTNESSATCMLDGYPTLQPISPSGQAIGVAVRNGGSYQIADPGPRPVVLTPSSSAYFGYGWSDVTQPEGSTAGCVNTAEVKSIPPGSQAPLGARAQLPSVCPGGDPSVTAVAPEPAFTTAGSPAKP